MKMAVSTRFTASALILLGLVLAQKELGDIEDGCAPGTYSYGIHCYTIFSLLASFGDAELACEGRGGILAVVKDPGAQLFIQKIRIRKHLMNYWIGLNDRQKEGVWVYSDGSRIQGFNGSRMQGFDGWFPGQPKNAQRTQHCVNMWMLKNLLWVDDDCGIRYLYICQFEARNCSANATRFEAYCLELSREFVTYDEADHACIARGGILAAVKTRAMHELLKTMIYSERWWKNISEQDVTHINRKHRYSFARSWIGIRYVQREWVYSDGTFVNPNFTKWAIGEPYDPEEGEDCVMSSQDWYDDLCNNVRPFICQYDRISRQVLPPVSPVYRATTKTPEPEAVVEKLVDEYTGIRLGPFEFAFLIFGCFVLGVVCSMLVFYKSRFLSNPRRRMKDDGQDMAILENEVTYPTQDDR